ncbi:pyridoxine 5-phosphate synthase [Rhodobium orientis]|uniref:Pyridoxine 5'-phosphate synthase n=1 Tax=Rhodobium orientis TaxID=34017 RepID=A0A327JG02_9HYPH|nr:pyridoxine 5'-phosphate synthase [Rhodobium orientis]MBB4305395.1 pyridoxine 5-phosphate synthase [Rhodobium orientis]MBK5950071.1 pyridoxine 5'-phosphate synthase [Rhodobium orientis]RAI25259.1 pyridoxine 5'-phosphate synthase [Rhodobium orientis]
MSTRLSVNLNAVAQLRNRRDLPWPSVTGIGRIALEAGAHGLTCHPRPDERHIRRSDVPELAALVAEFPGAEFNIEGYPAEDFLAIVEAAKPDQVTLVPDDPSQSTSDHGWDVAANRDSLTKVIARLKAGGMRVSLFVDPDDPRQPPLAAEVGADRVEIYTGPYGATHDDPAGAAKMLAAIAETAEAAKVAGLGINAGHDLTLFNLPQLIGLVPYIAEVSIGHGVTADALIFGMAETVRLYRQAAGNPV